MKKLCDLINCKYDTEIYGITTDSRKVQKGYLFVCRKGRNIDRHNYIDDAIKRGAVACIVTKPVEKNIPIVQVNDIDTIMGDICSKFYNYPQDKLKLIGVTGTDGKTTTATLIKQLLNQFLNIAYIGTNGCDYLNKNIKTSNTTPITEELYKCLDIIASHNGNAISMEVSSEALLENRVVNLEFDVSILTNVTEDHLNIHKSIDNYIECKGKLFEMTKSNGFCLLNRDDKYYNKIKSYCKGNVITYGQNPNADFAISNIVLKENLTTFTCQYKNKKYFINSPLGGKYNVYNLVASLASGVMLGFDIDKLISYIPLLKPIVGRGEFLEFSNDYSIVLDYAHTTNALASVLTYLNSIPHHQIITITGSAGGREKEKRPLMGKTVLELSDKVIFTMDDPRDEDPLNIINEMIGTCQKKNYEIIVDRKEAIYKALANMNKDDILLVTGKGRDNYMAIGNSYLPYNDYETIKSYFIKE